MASKSSSEKHQFYKSNHISQFLNISHRNKSNVSNCLIMLNKTLKSKLSTN